eukprot:3494523-Karenia_brevis.AAC.1
MISSTKWWKGESCPRIRKSTNQFFLAGVQGEAEWLSAARAAKKAGQDLQVVRIEHDHVLESAKFVDTCKQLSKHRFPQDYWEQRLGCWERVHMRPHRSLFTPTGTKNMSSK